MRFHTALLRPFSEMAHDCLSLGHLCAALFIVGLRQCNMYLKADFREYQFGLTLSDSGVNSGSSLSSVPMSMSNKRYITRPSFSHTA